MESDEKCRLVFGAKLRANDRWVQAARRHNAEKGRRRARAGAGRRSFGIRRREPLARKPNHSGRPMSDQPMFNAHAPFQT